ncbi:diacylglycerol/polyprenol kinase family protein [Rickettsiales bacterium LUAb2]
MNLLSPEITRKFVHLTSLIMPILYYFTNYQVMFIFLVIILLTITTWDLLRLYSNLPLAKYFQKLFLREKETKRFSGGFYFSLACLIALILFDKYVFILSVSILVICDTVAALIGINWGKHKLLDKSWEGTFAFFISGVIVVIVINFLLHLPLINFSLLIVILVTAIAELLANKVKIDDNLLIVITFGFFYYLTAVISTLLA